MFLFITSLRLTSHLSRGTTERAYSEVECNLGIPLVNVVIEAGLLISLESVR